VKVDTTDLSTFARSVSFSSEHARIDVSGFNALGVDEFLAGATTQSVTVEFFGSYGTAEVHQTVYPIHKNRTIVAFAWRPDQTAVASATNPELRGNVQVLVYNPSVTRETPTPTRSRVHVGRRHRARVLHHLMANAVRGPAGGVRGETLRILGYKEFLTARDNAGKDTKNMFATHSAHQVMS
jgi:hypothetical protein